MDHRTRALVVDFSLAGGAISLGALVPGPEPTVAAIGLASLGCLLFVGALYLLEQQSPLRLTAEYRLAAASVVFLSTFAAWGGLVLWGLVEAPAGAVLVGTGCGLLGYRSAFGLVRPLPAQRLAQAELLSGEDGDELRRPP